MKKILLALVLLASNHIVTANENEDQIRSVEYVNLESPVTKEITEDVPNVANAENAAIAEEIKENPMGLFSISSEETQEIMSKLNENEVALVKECTQMVLNKLEGLNDQESFQKLKVVLSEKLGRNVEIVVQLLLSLYELKNKQQENILSLEQNN